MDFHSPLLTELKLLLVYEASGVLVSFLPLPFFRPASKDLSAYTNSEGKTLTQFQNYDSQFKTPVSVLLSVG